mmetsp:Transcript_78905/g.226084  ORF Transcript_78905/g.226084 Transcript_78905/m.226084 type:complete len:311 (-) Transcript_78905:262-1194(-)
MCLDSHKRASPPHSQLGARSCCIALRSQLVVAIERTLEHHLLQCHLCHQLACALLLQQGADPPKLGPWGLALADELARDVIRLAGEHGALVYYHLTTSEETNGGSPTRSFSKPRVLRQLWPQRRLVAAGHAQHDLIQRLRREHGSAPRCLLAAGLGEPRVKLGDDLQLLAQGKREERPDLLLKLDPCNFDVRGRRAHGVTHKQQVAFHRLDGCNLGLSHRLHLTALEANACCALQHDAPIRVLHPDVNLLRLLPQVWPGHERLHGLQVAHRSDKVHGDGSRLEPGRAKGLGPSMKNNRPCQMQLPARAEA